MFDSLLRTSFMVVALYGFSCGGNAIAANPANQAPDFSLEGQQKQIELSKYHGKVVYVDFWASWCQPCRKSFTWMNKMQSLYGSEDFKVIAINLDESRAKADEFLQQIPANFDVAFDPQGNTAEAYKIKAMPSSYLIDKNGKVVHANLGFRGNDEDQLETKIRNLLRQSTVASR
jgi:thiol-disulfide isomerase/thioredoxin